MDDPSENQISSTILREVVQECHYYKAPGSVAKVVMFFGEKKLSSSSGNGSHSCVLVSQFRKMSILQLIITKLRK